MQDIYRAIFDNVNDAIILRDLKTKKIIDVNSRLCEMTGYTLREIRKLPPGWFSSSPIQNGKAIAYYDAGTVQGEQQLFERQERKKDGTLFWVESNLRKVTIGDREYLLTMLRDVTPRRQKIEELRQGQARYRSIVEDQRDFLVCHFLPDGTMTFVNEALCCCAGVRKEELVGRPFWPFIVKEYAERLRVCLAKTSTDNRVESVEHHVVRRDGSVRCLVWSGKALFNEHGTLSEFQAIGRDITEQKEAEEALKESEKTLRALLNAITEPAILLDVNRRVLALNETLAKRIGKDPQEILGACIDDYLDPEVIARTKKYTDSVVRTGEPVRFDSERAGKCFEYSLYPVFNDGGQVTRIAVYAGDVTVQKQAQRELEAKSHYLEEMNTALKVLLDQRELDKKELEDKVFWNVQNSVIPILRRLREFKLHDEARAFLDVLETNVNEIISPFSQRLGAYHFTSREREVISLVRQGKTTKEIAQLLNVSKDAVDIYRHHVRKKLGIVAVKTNLRSHLLSLDWQ